MKAKTGSKAKTSSPRRLEDRVVVITGGANGLGRVYSEDLMKAGASLVIADIDFESARSLAAALN
jgi:NAD(P)-dependent dehydrogenase (short-subunit alcohol dehydrogenase family)